MGRSVGHFGADSKIYRCLDDAQIVRGCRPSHSLTDRDAKVLVRYRGIVTAVSGVCGEFMKGNRFALTT